MCTLMVLDGDLDWHSELIVQPARMFVLIGALSLAPDGNSRKSQLESVAPAALRVHIAQEGA